jgi:hypothetical protein
MLCNYRVSVGNVSELSGVAVQSSRTAMQWATCEFTPRILLAVYTSLAAGGYKCEPRSIAASARNWWWVVVKQAPESGLEGEQWKQHSVELRSDILE